MRSGEYRSASPAQLRVSKSRLKRACRMLTSLLAQATLGRLSDRFLEPTQQDAHEVLLALLDGLHEDLNLVVDPPVLQPNSPEREAELERLPEVVAADQEWEKYRSRNDSIIIDFFQGERALRRGHELGRPALTGRPLARDRPHAQQDGVHALSAGA